MNRWYCAPLHCHALPRPVFALLSIHSAKRGRDPTSLSEAMSPQSMWHEIEQGVLTAAHEYKGPQLARFRLRSLHFSPDSEAIGVLTSQWMGS